jgi:hypothetical protein
MGILIMVVVCFAYEQGMNCVFTENLLQFVTIFFKELLVRCGLPVQVVVSNGLSTNRKSMKA